MAKGTLTKHPARRLRLTVGVHLLWLGFIILQGAWWVKLLLDQAARIAELERVAGVTPTIDLEHTRNMIFWESGTYIMILLVSTAALLWLYWRDAMRARSLEAFFASVTHELRTPLTSIRLQAESIADSLEGRSSQAHVKRLLEDTSRLESQVETTLELARLEGGGPVFVEPLPIKAWVERFVRNWESVKFQLALEDVSVEADVPSLQVVFRNLIQNAVRHSRREDVVVSMSGERRGGAYVITVTDNGNGTPSPRALGEIFQKGANSQGAGVGLYLVRSLMRKMGGEAAFKAQPRFTAELRFKEGT